MVAGGSRSRIVSIWFVAMLTLAGLAAIVPTASAASITAPTMTVHVNGVPVQAGHDVKLGDILHIWVNATASTANAFECAATPTWTTAVTADLTAFGLGADETIPDADETNAEIRGERQFTAGDSTNTGGYSNGQSVALSATVAASCTGAGGGATAPERTASLDLDVDTVPPSVAVTLETSSGNSVGVGQRAWLNLTPRQGMTDFAASTVSTWQFTTTYPRNNESVGGPPTSPGEFIVANTSISEPVLILSMKDTNGNWNNTTVSLVRNPANHIAGIDTKVPFASGLVVETTVPRAAKLTLQTADTDTTWTYAITPAGGTRTTTPTGLELAGLKRNTTYYVNVTPSGDPAGNAGFATGPFTFQTLEEPYANFTFTLTGPSSTGKGAIGSTYTIASNTTGVQDVFDASFTWPDLGITDPVVFLNRSTYSATIPAFGNTTPISSPTVWVNSSRGIAYQAAVWNASGDEDFTFIDTLAPSPKPLNLHVIALADLSAAVTFEMGESASSDIDAYVITYRNTSTGGTTQTYLAGGSNASSQQHFLPAGALDHGTEYEFTVSPRDAHGNLGTASNNNTITASETPLTVSFTGGNPTFGGRFPGAFTGAGPAPVANLTGVWSAPAGGGLSVQIAIQNLTDAAQPYWTGGAPTESASWNAQPTWWTVADGTGTSGTWNMNALYDTGNITAADAYALLEGKYRVIVRLTPADSSLLNPSVANLDYVLDRVAPVALSATGDNTYTYSPDKGLQSGVTPLSYRFDYNEVTAGFKDITFSVRVPGTTSPVVNLDGVPLTTTCPGASCAISMWQSNGAVRGNLTWNLGRLPVGDYVLHVSARDNATNVRDTLVATPLIKINPRLLIDTIVRPPFADEHGLDMHVYAAWDNATAANPQQNCGVSLACRVTEVQIYARNRTDVANAQGKLIGALFPTSDTPFKPSGSSMYYFDHAAPQDLNLSSQNLDFAQLAVRAVATVRLANGASYTNMTSGWIDVLTGLQPGGVTVAKPADDTAVFVGGTPGTIGFNVTLDQAALSASPRLNYTIFATNGALAGSYVRFDGSGNAVPSTASGIVRNISYEWPGHYMWNWTNNATLPRGEYIINVTANITTTDRTFSRVFAVETAPIKVTADVPQKDIFLGTQVRREFDITTRIDHGFANVSAPGLEITLLAPNQFGGYRTLRSGVDEGFVATIKSFDLLSNRTSTNVTLNVRLPSNATDGSLYYLNLNLTSDSFSTLRSYNLDGRSDLTSITNTTLLKTLSLDETDPTAAVFTDFSNATGNVKVNPTTFKPNELSISGTGSDTGSGVKRVEVRIYDVNDTETFVWNFGQNGSWQLGLVDSWMTSDLMQVGGDFVRNVVLDQSNQCTSQVSCWVVYDTQRYRLDSAGNLRTSGGNALTFNPIGFDRNHTYQVDVRVTDNLGKVSPTLTRFVAFDVVSPVVNTQLAPKGGNDPAADGFLDWHGAGNLTVTVSDNNCVKRVSLIGTDPNGDNITPVDFPRPAGAACNARDGYNATQWTLNLSNATSATQFIGRYNYSVEVEDAAGRITRGTNVVSLVVNDTQRAIVRNLYLEPPTVAVGAPSRIIAEIEEWGGIEYVRAILERYDGLNTQPVGEGLMRLDTTRASGNGTWWYVAQTDTDLNISSANLSVGDYLWTIRPHDTNWRVTCAPPYATGCGQLEKIVRITDDAAPFIDLKSPVGNIRWINATPTFRWEVSNFPGASESGVTLWLGNSTQNLTAINATSVTPEIDADGNATRAVIVLKPTLASDATNLTVRIRVATSTGFTAESTLGPYTVDATPPIVTYNVTGLTEIDGVNWSTSATRLRINATDAVSNVSGISYTVNGGTTRAYTGPIAPSEDGQLRIEWTVRDGAGNPTLGSVELVADVTGPTISVARATDNMLLVIDDDGIGVDSDSVTVHYAYGSATTFQTAEATQDTATSYSVALGGNASETGLRYYVTAADLLGNVATFGTQSTPKVITADGETPPPIDTNVAPVVNIVRPVAGSDVRGEITLEWVVSDADGDALDVTLALREPNGPGQTLRTNADLRGSFPITLTTAGPYTFVVIATDGNETTRGESTFTVLPGRTVDVLTPPPTQATTDQPVAFAVKVTPAGRTVASANYIIQRDGATIAQGAMTASGDTYSAQYQPDGAGDYEVLVVVTYTEGAADDPVSLGSFTVAGAPITATGGGMSAAFISLLVLSVLTIALASGGAFWRWKK